MGRRSKQSKQSKQSSEKSWTGFKRRKEIIDERHRINETEEKYQSQSIEMIKGRKNRKGEKKGKMKQKVGIEINHQRLNIKYQRYTTWIKRRKNKITIKEIKKMYQYVS